MNKKISIFLSIAAAAMLTACDNQKPSPRVDVYGDSEVETTQMSADKVYVPFTRTESNLIEVQVTLNGVPMNMIYDSGASMTSISALELQMLAKAGKIELSDYMGNIVTQIADGSTSEGAVFNIKGLTIKGNNDQYLVVRDMEAIVSANDDAPLLLGQNAIRELPKHTIDDSKGVIIFDKN